MAPPTTPPDIRFRRFVAIGAPDACWPWTGSRRKTYGKFCLGRGCDVLAHRYAYELAYGAIPPGKQVRHTCDNPPCCNPAHLVIGTHQDNMNDRAERGRTGRSPGESNGMAKLSPGQVADIRRRYSAGGSGQRGKRGTITHAALAAEYGVRRDTIGKIVRGTRW